MKEILGCGGMLAMLDVLPAATLQAQEIADGQAGHPGLK